VSMSRFREYRFRIGRMLAVSAMVLCVSCGFLTATALAQGAELGVGISVAEKMVGKTLAEGALVVAGLCVAALCFVIRIAYMMHTDQLRSMIERERAQTAADVRIAETNAELAAQIEALVVEMRRRPCMKARDE